MTISPIKAGKGLAGCNAEFNIALTLFSPVDLSLSLRLALAVEGCGLPVPEA
jgi:hypothetical protein